MATNRRYDDEFKKMAVKLIIEDGRKIANVSDELGVSKQTLREWVKLNDSNENSNFYKLKKLEAENKALKREVADLKDSVTILKKATAIFSQAQK